VDLHFSLGPRELSGRFLIDTGAPTIGVALARRFAREHNLLPDASAPIVRLPALCATSSLARIADPAEIGIGAFRLHKVDVLLSLDRSGAFAHGAFDGIIGGSLLRRFGDIVIDAPNPRLLIRSASPRK
jgi:hypothetical protein